MLFKAARVPSALILLLLAGSGAFGTRATLGYLMGVVVGLFAAASLVMAVRLAAGSAQNRRIGVALTLLAFFVKFPAVGFAGYAAWRMGSSALALFSIGVVMVYFGLVWTAASGCLFRTDAP